MTVRMIAATAASSSDRMGRRTGGMVGAGLRLAMARCSHRAALLSWPGR
jgi:hypothetical protein